MSPNHHIRISHYSSAKDNKGSDILTQNALAQIRDCIYDKQIGAIRAETDKKKRSTLKMKLCAVTWSGLFRDGRAKDKITEHSGLICLDFDDLATTESLKHAIGQMKKDSRVYACFISPSGNGFKVLVRVSIDDPAKHELFWAGLAEYFYTTYLLEADESGKDCSRLCFLSSDPDLYENADSLPFLETEAEFLKNKRIERLKLAEKTSRPAPLARQLAIQTSDDMLNEVMNFTNNKSTYHEGNENNYIYLFACNANRKGVAQDDALNFLKNNFGHDPKRIVSSVTSAYKNHTAEYAKYAKKSIPDYLNKEVKQAESGKEESEFDSRVLFWFEMEKEAPRSFTDQDTGEMVTLKGKTEYKFSYDDCVTFLTNNGFYKYRLDNKYQLIHVVGKFISIVEETKIREYIFRFLKTEPQEFKQVREMMRRGAKTYLSTHLFEQLDYFEPDIKRDDKNNCYIYFRNCYLQVTAAGVVKKNYEDLTGYIWTEQMIDFDYHESDYSEGDFFQFISLSMNSYLLGADGPVFKMEGDEKEVTEEDLELAHKRMQAVATGIGYMLHGWKDPSNCKALVAVDKSKSKHGEPNGRTGKSLLAKGFNKMIPTCTIDGPNFKFDKDFAFQRVNVDTKLINFNDVTRNFDFNKLFGMITEEFSFEKKRLDAITIPFKDSPKFYVSTNFTLKGEGESNIGRQFIIEFGNYFTSAKTPVTVFGKRFFDEWDEVEYCRFYAFMVSCIRAYLNNGLVDFPMDSYAERKLIDMAGPDFIVWMDEIVEFGDENKSAEFEKKELLINYREMSGLDKTTPNGMTKFVEMYAQLRGYVINKHAASTGFRVRKNNKDYITFYR